MSRVLGMNARNAHIAQHNPRWAVAAAKNKVETKRRLEGADVPVPPTLALVSSRRAVRRFDLEALPDRFVVKPTRGSMGRGVLVVTGRAGTGWSTGRGPVDTAALRGHLASIVDGHHSDHEADEAMVEPLLVPEPTLAALAPTGLPDVRVIVDRGQPLMAMMRLPTVASGGRGNLHQGGVGAAIDLSTGRVDRARHGGRDIDAHPDTLVRLLGMDVPCWPDLLDIAIRCGEASGLGYLGVDLVVDAERGPLVLEVNAHPGLEIQNVCCRPLQLV